MAGSTTATIKVIKDLAESDPDQTNLQRRREAHTT